MTNLTDQFRAEVDAFLADTGMSASKFGRDALNDTHFVRRLREQRDTKLATVDRVRAFMVEQRAIRANQPKSQDVCTICGRVSSFTFVRQRLCAPCFNRGMKAMVTRLAAERKLS